MKICDQGFEKMRSKEITYTFQNPIQYMITHGPEYDRDDFKINSIKALMDLLNLSPEQANLMDVMESLKDFKQIFD
jgi:hypothetical protein